MVLYLVVLAINAAIALFYVCLHPACLLACSAFVCVYVIKIYFANVYNTITRQVTSITG